MTQRGPDGLWRKAAVLGSLWAASEIVLGSFLHNTHLPLRGHLLTGIGIAILVAGHRLWPQRGLLWRAGLICAAMKSVSPSAVIFGPMVAISMEGFLMEAGVSLAGANPAGYLLAGGLAMSWPLFHKVGGFFLYYGPGTWSLYEQGVEKLRTWLGCASLSPWTPLLAVWAGHLLGGCLAAVIGMRVGRADAGALPPAGPSSFRPPPSRPARGDYSLPALALHLACVAVTLSLGAKLTVWGFAGAAAVYAAVCIHAYPRAAALMRRLSLWSGILAVSILAGWLLGRWEAGAQMGLRAVVLTMGFSCIGSELRNPAIRSWMARCGGQVFFDALETAFETLPGVLASIPTGGQLLRNPVVSLQAAIARAPALLDSLEADRVFIVTGGHGSGKSSLVSALAQGLRRSGISVGGILAPGFWEGGRRGGFDIVDLRTDERRPFCRTSGPQDWPALGMFRFSPDGLAFGLRALADVRRSDADVVMVDEVGPLELQGRGWAPQLDILAAERRKPMVWVVRSGLVEEVRRRWELGQVRLWEIGAGRLEDRLAELLAGRLSTEGS